MGYAQYGAAAEKIAVSRKMIWPQPKGWTSEQSAAFPVNFFTAYLAYWKAGMTSDAIEPVYVEGERQRRVLIHAVAGGVGTAAVQIGKLLRIETYGTASSAEKLERVAKLGLDHGINYAKSITKCASTSSPTAKASTRFSKCSAASTPPRACAAAANSAGSSSTAPPPASARSSTSEP